MKRAIYLLALSSVGVAASAAGGLFFEMGPDTVIFPVQEIPVYFDHAYHVRKPDEAKKVTGEGLSCTFCHENISESGLASDRDIPGHGSCDTCHDEWIGDEDEPAPIAECARCHKDLDPTQTSSAARKLDIPDPNIKFPHIKHVGSRIECVECHRNVPTKTVATRDDYPTMDRCIACHQEKGVSTECATCHETAKDGRVQMHYAEGALKPRRYHATAIHDASFLRDHAVPAQRDGDYCDSCHQESDCLACHDGVARDVRYHPGDWIATHYIRARKDDFRCQSCHRLQTFCINCHVRSGVASVQPTDNVSGTVYNRRTIRIANDMPIGPHPMGGQWTGLDGTRGRNFHGFHAQRNIRACASCHQEQYCLQCHTSAVKGGFRSSFNPHGPDRGASLRGKAGAKHAARACLKCHSPTDANWR